MYDKELNALKKTNRFRQRKLFDENLIDFASNDYLGLSYNKSLLQQAYDIVQNEKCNSSKASLLVNGYTKTHKLFEDILIKYNQFQSAIMVGSGFLANIALIESLVRKKDILFIDEEYHASGMLATKLVQGKVVIFKHNDYYDLEHKLKQYKYNRAIITIEGVYSMSGDIAKKEFSDIADKYQALLIVDEAHSSGVIGDNLLGWFDYYNLDIKLHYIKMGTLGKAYGSYGAYILGSNQIISFLENRAKSIIYTTALSIFDTALAYVGFCYILDNKDLLKKEIKIRQKFFKQHFNIAINSLIVPIIVGDNKKVMQIQQDLLKHNILVGAIRQPTVKQALIRIIPNLHYDLFYNTVLEKVFKGINI